MERASVEVFFFVLMSLICERTIAGVYNAFVKPLEDDVK
jgi:hypothetical protein